MQPAAGSKRPDRQRQAPQQPQDSSLVKDQLPALNVQIPELQSSQSSPSISGAQSADAPPPTPAEPPQLSGVKTLRLLTSAVTQIAADETLTKQLDTGFSAGDAADAPSLVSAPPPTPAGGVGKEQALSPGKLFKAADKAQNSRVKLRGPSRLPTVKEDTEVQPQAQLLSEASPAASQPPAEKSVAPSAFKPMGVLSGVKLLNHIAALSRLAAEEFHANGGVSKHKGQPAISSSHNASSKASGVQSPVGTRKDTEVPATRYFDPAQQVGEEDHEAMFEQCYPDPHPPLSRPSIRAALDFSSPASSPHAGSSRLAACRDSLQKSASKTPGQTAAASEVALAEPGNPEPASVTKGSSGLLAPAAAWTGSKLPSREQAICQTDCAVSKLDDGNQATNSEDVCKQLEVIVQQAAADCSTGPEKASTLTSTNEGIAAAPCSEAAGLSPGIAGSSARAGRAEASSASAHTTEGSDTLGQLTENKSKLTSKNQALTSLVEHLQAESLAPLPGPASAAGEDSSSQWLAALAADGSLLPAVRELMQQLAQALIAQRQLQDQLSLMEETEAHNAEITQRLTTANASSDGHTGQPAAAEGLTQAMAGPRSLPLCKTADSAGPERPAVPGSGPNFGKLAQLVSGAKALLGSKALPAAGQHTHPEKEAIPLSTTITISELSPTAERGSECSNAVPVSVTHTPQTAAILGVQQDGSKGGQPGHQMLLERIDELQKEVKRLSAALGYKILEGSRLSNKNASLAEANTRLMEESKTLTAEVTSLSARLHSSAEETADALDLASQVSDTLASLTEDHANLQDAHRSLADRLAAAEQNLRQAYTASHEAVKAALTEASVRSHDSARQPTPLNRQNSDQTLTPQTSLDFGRTREPDSAAGGAEARVKLEIVTANAKAHAADVVLGSLFFNLPSLRQFAALLIPELRTIQVHVVGNPSVSAVHKTSIETAIGTTELIYDATTLLATEIGAARQHLRTAGDCLADAAEKHSALATAAVPTSAGAGSPQSSPGPPGHLANKADDHKLLCMTETVRQLKAKLAKAERQRDAAVKSTQVFQEAYRRVCKQRDQLHRT